ncbi:LysR family transcriptional regulator [Vibrio tubiashii]|uniref:LysR family transcriptional regulator n=2 Tax=Vibrio tubiashii TaxID=29498 RepID=F9TC78_9VIBR|nr:LysR family transcriptional regulator [Vibrio tubiashii]AIW14514.1 LysR family transcriptional regulator [Vibrio tubiashii ATCC 19109]EGU48030.1 regulatory protein, LysR:LysR substrate-binding [Vibrio tubiashii ATCC 19109]EIF04074.1 regulatory protein LysR:LysR substrate-binding [Vibrio tubiashii NCIMB 1337 = ATCC 19106]MCG9579019.1 LysR family transcriptional regulator [Vibrio tubiashii]NOI80565.1 LysR family transcriptional regulator [Vibrio tubiashii]
MINLEQTIAFVTTVEAGSFSAAARKLNKSQSSVSIGVSNLEDELGLSLFDRQTRKPTLTKAGERLYQQAKLLLRQADKMNSFAQAVYNEVETKIVIGVDPMAPLSCLDSVLIGLEEKFPNTEVQIQLLDHIALQQALLNHEIDLGVHFGADAYPQYLNFITIHQYEWQCVCSPDYPLADLSEVSNEELLAARQIIGRSLSSHPVLSKTSIFSQDTWQADNLVQCSHLIELGMGWGILPSDWCHERIELGSLVSIKPEFNQTKMYSGLDLVWAANRDMGRVGQFIIDSFSIRKSNSN